MKAKQAQADKQPVVPRYLTKEQAAEYTGFKTTTLETWASRRVIPCIRGRDGRRFLRFDREELERFMRQYDQRPLD